MPKATPGHAPHSLEPVHLEFEFTLEDYMMLTMSRRVDQEAAALIESQLPRWGAHLHALRIAAGGEGYMLVWLDKDVEQEVNLAWESSPSRAFTLNSLAQSLLMASLRAALPEISATACAPAPRPTAALRAALEEAGVPWTEGNMLGRQYAMLTYAPYKGSCPICYLKETCPKLQMQREMDRGGQQG